MYNGYRIKINGIIFPNNYIAKGTYNITEAKRVVETWIDANQVEHQITTGTRKVTINFNIISHDVTDHVFIMYSLRNREEVEVEYFSDWSNQYETITCRVEDVTFAHLDTSGNTIHYAETPITLIQN